MSYLKNYLISLISAALLYTLIEELSPKKLRGALSFCLGLFFLLGIISPLPSLLRGEISGTDIFPEYSVDEGEGEYFDTALSATALGVARAVAQRFGVSEEDVGVTLVGFDAYKLTAEEVYVMLHGSAAYIDFHAVERYVLEIFGGTDGTKCRVEISLK